MESAADRGAYLDQACGDNEKLRAEVQALLRAHLKSGDLLDLPESPDATMDQPITEKPGTVIGRYKLLEQIGEGGFGVVFMAEQEEPVRRKVALKIIKPGMDTKEVIARFEAERQALAIVDLICQVETESLSLNVDVGEVCLTGETYNWEIITGCDLVLIAPDQD